VIGKELEKALVDCDKAAKLVPNNIDVLDTKGFVYLKMGDFAKARTEYDNALKLDPNHARALYGKGLARIKAGDKGGEADLAAATRIDANIGADFTKFGIK